jgi:hypothetical protein
MGKYFVRACVRACAVYVIMYTSGSKAKHVLYFSSCYSTESKFCCSCEMSNLFRRVESKSVFLIRNTKLQAPRILFLLESSLYVLRENERNCFRMTAWREFLREEVNNVSSRTVRFMNVQYRPLPPVFLTLWIKNHHFNTCRCLLDRDTVSSCGGIQTSCCLHFQAWRRHNPEDLDLYHHRHENLKFLIILIFG